MSKPLYVIISVLCVIALLFTVAFSIWIDGNNQNIVSPNNNNTELSIELPNLGEVRLVNDAIVEWMQGKYSAKALYNALREDGRMDTPVPVVIAYSINNVPAKLDVVSQTLEVSEHEDLREARVISIEPHRRRVEVYNLRTGMQYYYRLTIELSNGEQLSARSSFTTLKTPRFIQIDGVRNCRDIGGYFTADGKSIREGMVYRGTELDGGFSNKYIVTDAGKHTMLNELGIVTEIDLRAYTESKTKDMLGDEVAHNYYSYLSYMESFSDHGIKKIREVLECMADENNYPMYIHCSYGADRTGTAIYYLEAILGVSEEDLFSEWELSAFFVGDAFEEDMEAFVAELNTFEGDTMQEKVINFLLSIGVTQETMDKIRDILLYE